MAHLLLDRICRIATLAAGMQLAGVVALSAQVTGTVHDPAGTPVAEATVALWNGTREIARAVSDPSGGFHFSAEASAGATILLARRIGFRPASVALSARLTALSVTLEPVAAALPEVVTTAARRACPNRDEKEARRLWHAVSAHYATHPRGDGVWTSMFWSHREVTASEVGEVDESRISPGSYAAAGEMREGYYRSLAHDGYARRLEPGDDPYGWFFYWRYLPLHRELSEYFVETDFAERHSLGLWRTDDGAFTITFCGRDHSRPYLEGTLSIAPDTALRAARWLFRTPSPHEDAGMEASFLAPPRGASIWFVLPMRSVFWRRLGGSKTLYFQEASVYREWYMGPDAMLLNRTRSWTSPRP